MEWCHQVEFVFRSCYTCIHICNIYISASLGFIVHVYMPKFCYQQLTYELSESISALSKLIYQDFFSVSVHQCSLEQLSKLKPKIHQVLVIRNC